MFSAIVYRRVRFAESGIYTFIENSDGVAVLFINGQQTLRSFAGERDNEVDVSIRGGVTYSLQYGIMHVPGNTSASKWPHMSLTWHSRSHGNCDWGMTDYAWEDITVLGERHAVHAGQGKIRLRQRKNQKKPHTVFRHFVLVG